MAKNKCYVVWAGHKTGLFHSWAETQVATSGYPNAKFKGFPSEELAKAALEQGNPSTQTKEQSAKSMATIDSDVQFWIDGSCHPEIGRSGSGIVKVNPKLGKVLTVSCGGCDENGTNNTGELIALIESLRSANGILSKGKSVEVFSDSEYAINSVTKWAYKWKKNGWRKSDNKAIENQRLIEECHNLYTQLDQSRIRITHSPAHKGFYYNELADRLAQIAAQFRLREVAVYQAFDEDSIIKWKIGLPMPTLR